MRKFILRTLMALLTITAALPEPTSAQQAQIQTRSQNPGRVRLRGRIVDPTGEGVSYATVSLVDTTGVILTAWATDGNGAFDHEVRVAGRYNLSAAAVGFERAAKPVDIAAPATDIGELALSGGIEIDGVVVTSSVPLVKAEIDKITYNVEADPEAPVNTLLDMLRKVPLLSVDAEDNIMMQGQSNYKVLMNGKSSSMMDRSFREVARSMPASSVSDIEVITNPSSRYEAEGIGGIINIITVRSSVGGYNGSVNVGVADDNVGNLGGFLSATTGKFSISAFATGMAQHPPGLRRESRSENFTGDNFRFENTESRSHNRLIGGMYNIQASYEIDSLNLITMAVSGQHIGGGFPDRETGQTVFTDAEGNVVREFTSDMESILKMNYLSGNIDYQRLFRKPDRVLTLSYKLSTDSEPQEFLTRITGTTAYPSYEQQSRDAARFNEHTLQIDYTDPLSERHSIETGAKVILRQNSNDPATYNRTGDGDPWVPDPLRRNSLDYNQSVSGVYGAYTFKLEKFSIKAGARLEHTLNDGTFGSAGADTPFDNRMLNLVPYANLSYAPKAGSRYTLSYTRRLSRPSIWYLNPYVNDNNPMNVSYGNPELDAEIGHTFNATYGLFGSKGSLNLTGNAIFVNNAIERIATAHANGITTSTYLNIGRNARYSLNVYYSWRPSGKFTLTLNAYGEYADLRGSTGLRNSGWSVRGNLQTRVALWKGGAATANGYYSSPYITMQGRGMNYFYYGAGLSQQAFNQKVTFTLAASNPFPEYRRSRTVTNAETFYREIRTWQHMRQMRLSVQWNFGKTQVQVKRARRTITNDDQLQGGNGAISAQ